MHRSGFLSLVNTYLLGTTRRMMDWTIGSTGGHRSVRRLIVMDSNIVACCVELERMKCNL